MLWRRLYTIYRHVYTCTHIQIRIRIRYCTSNNATSEMVFVLCTADDRYVLKYVYASKQCTQWSRAHSRDRPLLTNAARRQGQTGIIGICIFTSGIDDKHCSSTRIKIQTKQTLFRLAVQYLYQYFLY